MRSSVFLAYSAAAMVTAVLLPAGCSSSDTPASDPAPGASADASPDQATQEDAASDAETGQNEDDGAAAPDADNPADSGTMTLDALVPAAAQAVCAALFRCCDTGSLETYFALATAKPSLESFASKVPPATGLDETGCAAVVAEMFAIVPFRGWIELAQQGHVQFVADGVLECVTSLQEAGCGQKIAEALHDGTCFGFDAPDGGALQRRMFARSDGPGAPCWPIFGDGFGAGFYGSCDPMTSFCCIEDPDSPTAGCGLPKEGLSGACQAAGAEGDSCAVTPPLNLCQTGLSCDAYSGLCTVQKETPLALGEECVDAGFNTLGVCENGWCDVFGTPPKCEPYKSEGEACMGGSECETGSCDTSGGTGVCAPWTYCVGP